MLVSIEILKDAILFFRENDKIIIKRDKYYPEFLISDEKNISEKIFEIEFPGIVEKGRKKIKTVFGEIDGYYIKTMPQSFFKISSLVEKYFNYYLVDFYNVDIRLSLRYLSENKLNYYDYKKGIPDFSGLKIIKFKRDNTGYEYNGKYISLRDYLKIMDIVMEEDPDILIMDDIDTILPNWIYDSKNRNVEFYMGRIPGWNLIRQKEYFSYGYTYHKELTYVPRGRSLIDPKTSFIYSEGGIFGVLASSSISSLDPSYASRSTPGTLISSMEVSKALRNGIAVPYHKSRPEKEKSLEMLIKSDKGGLVYQASPGIYWKVSELDFTSMYPSIIVKKNLSLETVNSDCEKCEIVPEIGYKVNMEKRGFLSYALEDFLDLRIKIKKLKKKIKELEGIDKAFKWMLVTSFGYTGYRNAKFGSIEVHESINAYARDIIIKTKDIVEKHGIDVISIIVDSLWVYGFLDENIVDEIEKETELPIELSGKYYWMKILPLKGEQYLGSPGRYIAYNIDGEYKIRGIMLRRHDTPEFIKEFQTEALELLKNVKNKEDVEKIDLNKIFFKYKEMLENRDVNPEKLLLEKRINKYPWEYLVNTPTKQILDEYYKKNLLLYPSEHVKYIIYSERPLKATSDYQNVDYSIPYYLKLLRDAYEEVKIRY